MVESGFLEISLVGDFFCSGSNCVWKPWRELVSESRRKGYFGISGVLEREKGWVERKGCGVDLRWRSEACSLVGGVVKEDERTVIAFLFVGILQ